jgi:hypothetical protein
MALRTKILLFLPLCLACKDVAAPRALSIQTDSVAYTLASAAYGYHGSIGFAYTNSNDLPVYIPNCAGSFSLVLQKEVGGQWVSAWMPDVLLCSSAPIVVQPGAEYRYIVHVLHCFPLSNCGPSFTVSEIPGQYRILLPVVYGTGPRAFTEDLISNTFSIGIAPPVPPGVLPNPALAAGGR